MSSSGWTLDEALRYGRGTERPFLCPVHGDSSPSASVNIEKKVWYCYTCHAHGTLTGEALLMEPDYYAIARRFERTLEAKVYPEGWLNQFDAGPVHPYWLRRVGEDAARHFRLGYDREADAGTYPLRDVDGRVLGVVRRAMVADSGPRYRYPYGVDVGKLLFNYRPGKQTVVVLVEGALDTVPFYRIGFDHAWAIFGSRYSEHQRALVDQAEPDLIITATDQDTAGWRAHYEIERAHPSSLVARLTWPKGWGKDVDEIGLDRLRQVLSNLLHQVPSGVVSTSWKPHTNSSQSTKPRLRITRTQASA